MCQGINLEVIGTRVGDSLTSLYLTGHIFVSTTNFAHFTALKYLYLHIDSPRTYIGRMLASIPNKDYLRHLEITHVDASLRPIEPRSFVPDSELEFISFPTLTYLAIDTRQNQIGTSPLLDLCPPTLRAICLIHLSPSNPMMFDFLNKFLDRYVDVDVVALGWGAARRGIHQWDHADFARKVRERKKKGWLAADNEEVLERVREWVLRVEQKMGDVDILSAAQLV
ncbi:hypothetical protein HDV00_012525 [Rhizophlyctis rosea]|nr:hypothetical protein HDV00_012525 [Rhizophlyctis rosea]